MNKDVANYLVRKYKVALAQDPQYARQIATLPSLGIEPAWYTSHEGNVSVNETGIRQWCASREFTPQEKAYYTDRPPPDHTDAMRQTSIASSQAHIVDDGSPFFDDLLTQPCSARPSWEAFVPTFMTAPLWSFRVVHMAHWQAQHLSEQQDRQGLHPTVWSAIVSNVSSTLPQTKTIGYFIDDDDKPVGAYPYPLNGLLLPWLTKSAKNHRSVVLTAVAIYRGLVHDHGPEPMALSQHLSWATQASYGAYMAHSLELLRRYPQLILLITHEGTLEQIQLECVQIAALLQLADGALNAQPNTVHLDAAQIWLQQLPDHYNPIDDLIVSPDLLKIAGMSDEDIVQMARSGDLARVINSACYPDILPDVRATHPGYVLYGQEYKTVCHKKLLTYADQLQWQRCSPRTAHLAYREDIAEFYPTNDPYQTKGHPLPIRQYQLGENAMNPNYHFPANVANPYFAQQVQAAPVHDRVVLFVPQLFMPGTNQVLQAPVEHLIAHQNQNARQGIYFGAPVNGQIAQILLRAMTPQGQYEVVVVNPALDASLRSQINPMQLQQLLAQVPGELLPGVPPVQPPMQAMQLSASGGLISSAVQSMQQVAPQQVQPIGPRQVGTLQELQTQPPGTFWEGMVDGEMWRYTKIRNSPNPMREKIAVPKLPSLSQTAQPAPEALPSAPTNASDIDVIIAKELERSGLNDPIVARNPQSGELKLSTLLMELSRNPKYPWVQTAMPRTAAYAAVHGYAEQVISTAQAPKVAPMATAAPQPVVQNVADRVASMVAAIRSRQQQESVKEKSEIVPAPAPVVLPEYDPLDNPDDDFSVADDLVMSTIKEAMNLAQGQEGDPPQAPKTNVIVEDVYSPAPRIGIDVSISLVAPAIDQDETLQVVKEGPVLTYKPVKKIEVRGRRRIIKPKVDKVVPAKERQEYLSHLQESIAADGIGLPDIAPALGPDNSGMTTEELLQEIEVSGLSREDMCAELSDENSTVQFDIAYVPDEASVEMIVSSIEEATSIAPPDDGAIASITTSAVETYVANPLTVQLAKSLLDEGASDAQSYVNLVSESMDEAAKHPISLTLDGAVSTNSRRLLHAWYEIDRLVCARLNYTLKYHLGKPVRIDSLADDWLEHQQLITDDHSAGGGNHVWLNYLQSSVIQTALKSIVSSSVSGDTEQTQQAVMKTHVCTIYLGTLFEELGIGLDAGGLARGIKVNSLLKCITDQLDAKYGKLYDFDMAGITQALQIAVVTLDAKVVLLTPHPSNIKHGNGRDRVWMAALLG
jgi:hypothetical protein